MHDWIAVTGLRRFDPDAADTDVPVAVMTDPSISLEAKGLYALLLSCQGQPIDPYEDAIEDSETIAAAVQELISAGLAARVSL